jgi:hypothetical protein
MKGNLMAFGKKKTTFGCLMAGTMGVSCDGPAAWWMRLGCGHMAGMQVCNAHKTRIDQGDVPDLFTCPCGPPVFTPV